MKGKTRYLLLGLLTIVGLYAYTVGGWPLVRELIESFGIALLVLGVAYYFVSSFA